MVLLIDGNNNASRAFYGYPEMQDVDGNDIRCLYGVLDTIRKCIEIIQDHHLLDRDVLHVVVAWDNGIPAFRKSMYPAYKNKEISIGEQQDKEKRKEAMVSAINQFCFSNMRDWFPILHIVGEQAEGDDVISVVCKQVLERVVIVSTDTDFYQLIDERVYVLNPKTEKLITSEQLKMSPRSVLEMKLLMGDPSDNLPGAKGVGEISAQKLVEEFRTIENMLAYYNLDVSSEHRHYNLLKKVADSATYLRDVYYVVDLQQSYYIPGLWESVYSHLTQFAPAVMDTYYLHALLLKRKWVQALMGFNASVRPFSLISNANIEVIS